MGMREPSPDPSELKESLASVAEIYNAIYNVKRIGFYRILREMVRKGVRKRTSALQKLRIMAKLHDEDVIRLRLDYYIHLMRLGMAMVYLGRNVDCDKLPQVTPFLRSCVNIIPAGTLLTFYYPEQLRPRKLEWVGVKHYTLYERIFNRADIHRYLPEIAENPLALFSQRRIEEHFSRELRRSRDEDELAEVWVEVHGQGTEPKIDSKDLTIIGSIELDPLTTVSLDVKLGIKKDILMKHIEHAEAVIRGIRVRKIKSVMDVSRTALIAVVSGSDKQILRVSNVALKYPITVASSTSRDVRLLTLQLLLPNDIDVIRGVTTTLKKVALEHGLEVLDHYLVDLATLTNFTVPFIRELEYSPIARDWLEKSVRRSLKYLKEG